MIDQWCWYDVFDIKLKTVMNWKPMMKKTKWFISKTLAWDISEMIAYQCADECLEKRYYNVQRRDVSKTI